MSASQKVLCATVAFAALMAGALLIFFHEIRVPQNENQVFARVIELQKWGRYDKAVEVLGSWMNNGQRDISRDDFLFFEMAMIYIAKAYKKPSTKSDSIHHADLNLQKALAFYDSNPPKDIDAMLFEIGGAYEILGDLSGTEKCHFYDRASEELARQLTLIKGESYTAYGHTTRLEPVRADVKKHIGSTKEKYSKAACKIH